jgi:hypothetical protein
MSEEQKNKLRRPKSEEHKKKLSKAMTGRRHSEETKAKMSSDRAGDGNSNWKGGVRVHGRGYILIYCPEHPYAASDHYILEHRLVYERFLGRYLTPPEVIHYVNGNPMDNRIINLCRFNTQAEHVAYHNGNHPTDR